MKDKQIHRLFDLFKAFDYINENIGCLRDSRVIYKSNSDKIDKPSSYLNDLKIKQFDLSKAFDYFISHMECSLGF